jgi:hypothetical protein
MATGRVDVDGSVLLTARARCIRVIMETGSSRTKKQEGPCGTGGAIDEGEE